jgi:hypothetical protein
MVALEPLIKETLPLSTIELDPLTASKAPPAPAEPPVLHPALIVTLPPISVSSTEQPAAINKEPPAVASVTPAPQQIPPA